jgi:putative membrane protein
VLRPILPTSPLRRVLLWSLVLAAYSVAVVWFERDQSGQAFEYSAGLEAVLSLVIGMLLAFRVKRAFERWWEGRILWGTLVNACRNLAVKVNNVVHGRDESFDRMRRLIVDYPVALRDHLRGGAKIQQLPGFTREQADAEHVPCWIVNQIYGTFEQWKLDERIQYGEFRMLDREVRVLLEVCGSCERIKSTTIAVSFRIVFHQAQALFLFTLPWGLVAVFGAWTIAIVFLTSYFVIAAEDIALHVEQPFSSDGNGLDLDGICERIEASVEEIFATETVPGQNDSA